MKRRHFISSSAIAALSFPSLGIAQMDCSVQRLPGTQLFTIREALENDPDRALGQLVESGIREVELYGMTGADSVFGVSLKQFRGLLDAHGLSMTYSHINADGLDVEAVSRAADILGVETVIMAAAPGLVSFGENGVRARLMESVDEWDRLADLLNSVGRDFQREGLVFAYHNHHVEFLPVDGVAPYDHVMANTDPQLVQCELDLGWLALAGKDYLAYLRDLGPRVVSCHLKDFDGRKPADMTDFLGAATHLVPPGRGTIDFNAVLGLMDSYAISHGFVEVDSTENPYGDITEGVLHLESLRSC